MDIELLKALRQQFRARERIVRQFPDHRKERREIEAWRQRVASFLNEEQIEFWKEGEERTDWLQDKEKERLFYQGMMTGLQLGVMVHAIGMPCSLLDELDG
ncbi:hypothetical protein [Paenibacillus sp. S150]|uniref:hypothetical protein n=1 Tax=Paenibacillus sp. S150 TaxID=2749826 RepID=UPI001C59B1BF|nr:hypothetical protein [Paenibacillus sp. S150]MBW4081314.1 hypothetical protein [Paenibacillus sp. S150]